MTLTVSNSQARQAADLRAQALALLEQAAQLDGLKPHAVVHQHEQGPGVYIGWFAQMPTEEEAVQILDTEFEPDRREWIAIDELPLTQIIWVEKSPECAAHAVPRNHPSPR